MTDAPGVDHRRARSLLAQDLDRVEEWAQDREGWFKAQIAGPWTLAATVEKPRGDKVISDSGARRDLAQALAHAAAEHVHDVRRRLPRCDRLIVQVDEPALAAVLVGAIPTASGFGRHRTVHPPETSETLSWLLHAVTDAGAEPWIHSCAPETPLELLRGAGARGLAIDLDQMGPRDHDVLAAALDAGDCVVLGVVATDRSKLSKEGDVVERVLRWLDLVGLDLATVGEQLLVSASCGLARAPASARDVLRLNRGVAEHLS